MNGQGIRVKHFLQVVHAILNAVHVLNSGFNRWKLRRDGGSVRWFKEPGAKRVVSQREAPSEREAHEMTAAATMAITIISARLAIALILRAMHLAAVLAAVGG